MTNRSLEVKKILLFPKEDGVKHHTDKFHSLGDNCVLRRGETFHLVVVFDSSYDPRLHRVLLEFHAGVRRVETTSHPLPVAERDWPPEPWAWGARTAAVLDGGVAVMVHSPAWLPVGSWTLNVKTELIRNKAYRSTIYKYPGRIYFLFNPWNKDDNTYMEDEDLLEEYVLNDVGNVWTAINSQTPTRIVWDFSQFEDIVIPALELALERDRFLPRHRRGDPILMSRAISRIVNMTNDRKPGILVGRWDGKYEDGKSPEHWTGSLEILHEYMRSSGRPVKYAQCWVFAGLTVTFCRAIGLPCRLVSNMNSGHDSDFSQTIDYYYDENLNRIRSGKYGIETIWNFHVWVDVWMRRHDLRQPEYDGWQTIDGTPQEPSGESNIYQCGPAPVKSVRAGDTQVPFDVPFVFAEVNGDRARWMITRDHEYRLIDVHEKIIGLAVLTDDPRSKNPRAKNITEEYKPPEGSTHERTHVWKAANASLPHMAKASRIRRELDAMKYIYDVNFQADSPYGIQMGEDFEVALIARNKSDEERNVQVEMLLEIVDHMGYSLNILKSSGQIDVNLRPQEGRTLTLNIKTRDYVNKLMENSFLIFKAKCSVKETEQPWLSEDEEQIIDINFPNLSIEFNRDMVVNRPAIVFLSLDRVLNFRLTGCQVRLGGSGLERGGDAIALDDVQAGEKLFVKIRIVPVRAGLQKITVKLTSAEIPKLEALVEVEVLEPGGVVPLRRNFDDHMNDILGEAFDNLRVGDN